MKKHNMKPTQLLGAFAISYALMYLSNLAGQFFTNIIGIIKGSPVDDAIADLVSELNPLTAFFVMVLLAPALEEWIFRKHQHGNGNLYTDNDKRSQKVHKSQ